MGPWSHSHLNHHMVIGFTYAGILMNGSLGLGRTGGVTKHVQAWGNVGVQRSLLCWIWDLGLEKSLCVSCLFIILQNTSDNTLPLKWIVSAHSLQGLGSLVLSSDGWKTEMTGRTNPFIAHVRTRKRKMVVWRFHQTGKAWGVSVYGSRVWGGGMAQTVEN